MERLAKDENCSPLRTFVNYRRNFFITLAAGVNLIKHITDVICRKVCDKLKC
jgi:hypothetical protein